MHAHAHTPPYLLHRHPFSTLPNSQREFWGVSDKLCKAKKVLCYFFKQKLCQGRALEIFWKRNKWKSTMLFHVDHNFSTKSFLGIVSKPTLSTYCTDINTCLHSMRAWRAQAQILPLLPVGLMREKGVRTLFPSPCKQQQGRTPT